MPKTTIVDIDGREKQIATDRKKYGHKSPENCERLRDRLDDLVDGSRLFPSPSAFAEAIRLFFANGDAEIADATLRANVASINNERVDRFKGGDYSHFSKATFELIVHFLLAKGLYFRENRGAEVAAAFADPLFHSMISFLGITDVQLAKLRYGAPGLYRAYRPSSTYPDMFWIGLLEVTVDDSGVVKTTETYRAQAMDGRPSMRSIFHGYMFRKDTQHFIVSRDSEESSISMTMISSWSLDRGRMLTMRGCVSDMSRGRLYSSRIIYERHESVDEVTEEIRLRHLEALEVVSYDKVPPSIVNYFVDKPIPHIKFY